MPVKFVPLQRFAPDASPIGETSALVEATNFLPAFGNYRLLRRKNEQAKKALSYPVIGGLNHIFSATNSVQVGRFLRMSPVGSSGSATPSASPMRLYKGDWWNQWSNMYTTLTNPEYLGTPYYPSRVVETTGTWVEDGPVSLIEEAPDSYPNPSPPTDGLEMAPSLLGSVKVEWDAKDLPRNIVDAGHWGTDGGEENPGPARYPIAILTSSDGIVIDNLSVKVDGVEVYSNATGFTHFSEGEAEYIWCVGRPRKSITLEFDVDTLTAVTNSIIGGIAMWPLVTDNDWVQKSVGSGSGLSGFLSLSDLQDTHNGGLGTLTIEDYGATLLPFHPFEKPSDGDANIRFWYRVRNVKEDGSPWAIRWLIYEYLQANYPVMDPAQMKLLDSGLLTGTDNVNEWTPYSDTSPVTGTGTILGGTTLDDTTDGWRRLVLVLVPSADPNKAPDIFIDQNKEAVYNNGWKTDTGNKSGLQDATRKKSKKGAALHPASPASYIQSNAADDGEAEIIFKLENNDTILSLFSDDDADLGAHLPVKIWGQFPQDGLNVEVTIYEDWEADDDNPDTQNPTRILKQWTAGIDGTDITAGLTWQVVTVNGETNLEWELKPTGADEDDLYVRDFNNLFIGVKVSVASAGTQWQTYPPTSDGTQKLFGKFSLGGGASDATDALSTADGTKVIDLNIGASNNFYQPRVDGNALAGESYLTMKIQAITNVPPDGTEARIAFKVKRDQARGLFTAALYKHDENTKIESVTINPGDADWRNGTGNWVTGSVKLRSANKLWAALRENSQIHLALEGSTGSVNLNDTAACDYLALEYGADTIVKIANISIDQPSTSRIDIGDINVDLPAPETRKKADEETLFVGTRDKLWMIENGVWTDESDATYGSAEAPAHWCFAQWGNTVIATNGVDEVKSFAVGTSSTFGTFCETDADGNATENGYNLAAKYVGVVRPDVVVLANITKDINGKATSDGFAEEISPDTVWWGGIGGGVVDTGNGGLKANFTIPTADPPTGDMDNDAGSQRLRETPGEITGLLGGETALIFKRAGIWQMVYTGDPTFLFDFRLVTRSHGTPCHHSIVEVGNDVFFWTGSTFAVLQNRNNVVEIGQGVVRRMLSDIEFSADSVVPPDSEDPSARELHVVGTYDRHSGIIFWAFSSPGDEPLVKDKVICFNPATQQWGFLSDSRLSITYLMPTNTVDTREEHLTKGLLGVDWDGTDATVFTFSGDGNYEGRLRTSIVPILDGAEVQVNRVRPLYNVITPGAPVSGPAGPLQIEVSGRAGQEPTLTVGPQSEDELGKDSDGWSLIRLNGEWHEFTFIYPESLDRPVTTDYGILGYHIEFDTETGTGYGR